MKQTTGCAPLWLALITLIHKHMATAPLWLELINEEKTKKTGRLDLGRTGLTFIPDELKEMDWLEELILGNDSTQYPGYETISTATRNQGVPNELRSVGMPSWISEFKKLKMLALHDLQIGRIPAVPNAVNIEILDLDGNVIESISENIHFFPNLKTLYLGNNNLTKIENLDKLQNLENLHLNLNQLTAVENLEGLPNLKELVLVGNTITQLNGVPPALQILDLSENRISSLRELDFTKLSMLKDLRLATNNISVTENLDSLGQLEKLNLSFNQVVNINLGKLPALKELKINENSINEIYGLQSFTELEILELNYNRIEEIQNLDGLVKLKKLLLEGNEISFIKNLEPLSNLEELNCSMNSISVIENLEGLPLLTKLDLSANEILNIENLGKLTKLRKLNLAGNSIKKVPSLSFLKNLELVDLSGNEISDLSNFKSFIKKGLCFSLNLSEIKENGIYVGNNPLSIPSEEVIAQGKDAVLRYFASLEQTKSEQLQAFKSREVKLILLGNSNVGKTHLATYLRSDRKQLPPRSVSTHGMAYQKFRYNYITRPGEYVTVRMFDFGGQEYYHDTHHLFFTEDTAYFLLWESGSNYFGEKECERYLNNDPGSQPVKEKNYCFPIVYWLDAMNSIMKKRRTDFFGDAALQETDTVNNTTKMIDVLKMKNLVLVETKRTKDGAALLNSNDFIRFEPLVHSSASLELQQSNDTIVAKGINNLLENFEEIIDKLVEKTWSAYFGFVNHFCSDLRENPNKKEVQDIMQRAGIKDKLLVTIDECRTLFNIVLEDENTNYTFDTQEQVEDMCRYLANRGFIIYQNNQQVCLYPQELTQKMYDILSKPQTGIIRREVIEQKTGEECGSLLQLMQEYRLLIPHTILANTFIAPQNLPDTADDTVKLFLNSFQKPALRYKLNGYIHKNTILEIFFAFKDELIRDVSNNYFWKNGLVIKNSSVNDLFKIEFVQNESARYITISSLNQNKDYSLLTPVESKVEAVLKQRSYDKQISIDGIDFISYAEAEKNAVKNNAVFIQNDKQYRIADYKTFLRGTTPEYLMKKLFISYSSKDSAFMHRFVTHLEPLRRQGLIDVWHDRMIEPGTRWDDSIKQQMDEAEIIVMLLSPDFIATSYVVDTEIPKALERLPKATLFLVLLKHCGWDKSDLRSQQATQDSSIKDRKEIITIKEFNNDEAWNKIVYELEQKIRLNK